MHCTSTCNHLQIRAEPRIKCHALGWNDVGMMVQINYFCEVVTKY
jgi:hypothetical protein